MESKNLNISSPATGATSRRGATKGRWLGGWRSGAVASVVIAAGIGLALSQHWFDIADLLPLLFVLPCMAMMFVCMKGMNHNQQVDTPTKRGSTAEGSPTATDPRH